MYVYSNFSNFNWANANIKNFETVNTSSPSFLRIIKSLGAKFYVQK